MGLLYAGRKRTYVTGAGALGRVLMDSRRPPTFTVRERVRRASRR